MSLSAESLERGRSPLDPGLNSFSPTASAKSFFRADTHTEGGANVSFGASPIAKESFRVSFNAMEPEVAVASPTAVTSVERAGPPSTAAAAATGQPIFESRSPRGYEENTGIDTTTSSAKGNPSAVSRKSPERQLTDARRSSGSFRNEDDNPNHQTTRTGHDSSLNAGNSSVNGDDEADAAAYYSMKVL